MTTRRARLCCLDLDTFFVSVERLLDPGLHGVAVVVGGHKGGRGVVTSASYEARAFGVRSGMSIRDASALAPDAVFLPGHHEQYTSYSRRAREIVERFSPTVVAASIDEQYVDFHGCESLYRKAEDADDDATILRVVRTMTKTIDDELGLPASAGIATSKSLAKVACTLAKPRGVRFVRPGEEEAFLAPLPVRKLPGIGPVSEAKLARAGIVTLADLARAPDALLRPVFGAYTAGIRRDARGLGGADLGRERPAFREHDPRGLSLGSISNERTFAETSASDTASILCGLCERVCARARSRGVRAGCVTLRLRYSDFETITRSRSIAPTNVDVEVHCAVLALYRRARTRRLPVRLLGVALSKLSLEGPQLQLPAMDGGARRARTIDAVREKYGYDALHLATTTERSKRRSAS
ncbi:MAG TPA: DNA polymerase IV [Polyangiaceae bacterium]|nr:DNA polymerase IV [Polyangiaceae bacterium]